MSCAKGECDCSNQLHAIKTEIDEIKKSVGALDKRVISLESKIDAGFDSLQSLILHSIEQAGLKRRGHARVPATLEDDGAAQPRPPAKIKPAPAGKPATLPLLPSSGTNTIIEHPSTEEATATSDEYHPHTGTGSSAVRPPQQPGQAPRATPHSSVTPSDSEPDTG
jgi:hypothetical protein